MFLRAFKKYSVDVKRSWMIGDKETDILAANKFTYENKRIKKKEYYWLLEKIQTFNKLENLVISDTYM